MTALMTTKEGMSMTIGEITLIASSTTPRPRFALRYPGLSIASLPQQAREPRVALDVAPNENAAQERRRSRL
jgi:hypothetical protein